RVLPADPGAGDQLRHRVLHRPPAAGPARPQPGEQVHGYTSGVLPGRDLLLHISRALPLQHGRLPPDLGAVDAHRGGTARGRRSRHHRLRAGRLHLDIFRRRTAGPGPVPRPQGTAAAGEDRRHDAPIKHRANLREFTVGAVGVQPVPCNCEPTAVSRFFETLSRPGGTAITPAHVWKSRPKAMTANRLCLGLGALLGAMALAACGGSGDAAPATQQQGEPPPPATAAGTVAFTSATFGTTQASKTVSISVARTDGADGAVSVSRSEER